MNWALHTAGEGGSEPEARRPPKDGAACGSSSTTWRKLRNAWYSKMCCNRYPSWRQQATGKVVSLGAIKERWGRTVLYWHWHYYLFDNLPSFLQKYHVMYWIRWWISSTDLLRLPQVLQGNGFYNSYNDSQKWNFKSTIGTHICSFITTSPRLLKSA